MSLKSASPRLPRDGRFRSRQQGIALVVVLSLIVLISMMVIGLLVTAENEAKTNSRVLSALDARMAADSALQIVQGNIREATISGIDPNDGIGHHTWASQPGAVRIYDSNGREIQVLKLYSSDKMSAPDGSSLSDGSDTPADWKGRPNEFVDLNEPVNRNNQWIFPIASPDMLNIVAGFSSSRPASTGIPWDDRLAMPTRWLYMLEDGTISADPAQGSPVIRFAFWTDDESSKVNINTASATDSKSPWDIPRTTFSDDLNLYAWRQPVENEFNRYPGHPATVNLQSVLTSQSIKDIIQSTPRYEWGGSENGALKVDATSKLPTEKRDTRRRLYATPDEYLYTPERESQLAMDAPALDSLRFFLTTSSRSSDLNLFGQPRVTIWPISKVDDKLHRTIYDRTIAFSSTIGTGTQARPYYFQRIDSNSKTADWDNISRNREIFAYLQNLTDRNIPGFGGNFLAKYNYDGVSGEKNQILTEIFDYIRTVNLNETYKNRNDGLAAGEKFVSYTNSRISGNDGTMQSFSTSVGSGWVMPIVTPYGRGSGRVPVLAELGLWFIQMQDVTHETDGVADAWANPDPPQIQPGLIVETFSPMQGIMAWIPKNFSYRVRNITAPKINGKDMFHDGETQSSFQPPSSSYSRSQDLGGTDGFAWTMSGGLSAGVPNALGQNPFLTSKPNAIPLPPGATTFTITAGEIEVDFMTSPSAYTSGSGQVFQTYRVVIPETTLPVPAPVKPNEAVKYKLQIRNGWDQRKPDGTTPPVFDPADVVRGLAIKHGDYRTLAYMENVPSSFFQDVIQADHGIRTQKTQAYRGAKNGSYISVLAYAAEDNTQPFFTTPRPKIPTAINGLVEAGWDADFDNGLANIVDGPYLNKSDEGALPAASGRDPYFFERSTLADGLFSPFRQVPSAVVFGSLPTGVKHAEAGKQAFWRTLAFAPNPLSGSSHLGLSDPPDHLLLDLFTMPIVEPYAISEPFSTAGRLNLNYKIAPFTYITRKTALHAALASQQVIAIKNEYASEYKTNAVDKKIRFPVDIIQTLKAMDDYLVKTGQAIFRSASEICAVPLIPKDVSATSSNIATWWNNYKLTGNNAREKPYTTLYPLLTTKSNTFTMHIRVQAIKRLPRSTPADPKFVILSEYRGSVLFERYLDPLFADSPSLAGKSIDPDNVSLEKYFRFRTLLSKQFDP